MTTSKSDRPARPSSRKALISDIAASLGLHPGTVHYYENIGLIRPSRSEGGYRIYIESDYRRLRFIIRAKELNLTLTQIREILSPHDKGEAPCGQVVDLFNRKVAAIDA